jgi:hypothetical protein
MNNVLFDSCILLLFMYAAHHIFSDGDEKNFGQGLNQQGRSRKQHDRGAFNAGGDCSTTREVGAAAQRAESFSRE